MKKELVIIGGGAAGLSAAIEARKKGVQDILILERSEELGGILRQCIHAGFGVHKYKTDLTGVEFAQRLRSEIKELGIEYLCGSFVIDMSAERLLTVVHPERGLFQIQAGAIILAMGCRERSRGALMIPGKRIAGVITAGTAQRYLNLKGYLPGKRIVILGSGDIGLIMARQFALEGAEVIRVVEIMPHSSGLARNISQCLEDFDIPLSFNSTVTDIQGRGRVESVTVSKVDESLKPILGTEEIIPCDTLLISAGLIPENELTKAAEIEMAGPGPRVNAELMTSAEGIFACGNVLHIHDLVDHVAAEGTYAGACAAKYLGYGDGAAEMPVFVSEPAYEPGKKAMICLGCPKGCRLVIDAEGNVSGNSCPKGEAFARQEAVSPMRMMSCLMRVAGQDRVFAVRTKSPIPKAMMHNCAEYIYAHPIAAERLPVHVGDVLIENILESGADIVAAQEVEL
ncbi:MAG: FAD-dependent oxidoreductase [Oscillospiraceae bacterium]|nr:FAD-dependent oxidoreductase [Oscillospiraceae bacterium]